MLQECVDVFCEELKEKTIQWLLDNYVPKDGTYILLNMENGFSVEKILDIKTDKKTGNVQGETDSEYKFIAFLDYYSQLIGGTSKALDAPKKIIHSNNMYTFFVQKESLKEKLTNESIEKYYSNLRAPYYKESKNSNSKELYKQVEQKLGSVDVQQLEKIYQWIKNNFRQLIEKQKIDVSQKGYLKLFFIESDREKTKKKIKEESDRYLIPKIYNKNDYNIRYRNEIIGVSNDNMGMALDKKPYLANNTRKIKQPYMISLNQAIKQKLFFDYLAGQVARGKNNIYVDLDKNKIYAYENGKMISRIDTGIYLRVKNAKTEVEICSTSRITGYQSDLSQPFDMINVMKIPDTYLNLFEPGYGRKNHLSDIEILVDDVFFGKRLKYNYFTKPEDLSFNNGVLKSELLKYREQFWNWFYTGDIQRIGQTVDKMAIKLIVESIANENNFKAKHQINLWISIMDYLSHDRRLEKRMEDVRAELRKHIDCKEEWMFSDDKEYYYAVGQLLNTFLKLNRSKKKSLSLVNPVLNAKTDTMVKNRMLLMFKKYNYAVEDSDFRIKNLYGHVMRYVPETKVDGYFVSAGFVDNNLVYMKKDTDNQSEEDE